MLIAIWGRDGTGKSTLSDALSVLFAKQGITAIIDTDLTQPTLPQRISGQRYGAETSLGRAISGTGIPHAAHYLHQHPKIKQLFYAGLTDRDDYLGYELGLEAADAAKDFAERCGEIADTVILDLSGQRSDPFVPYAFSAAEKILIPIIPDVQGTCWFSAVKPFLEAMNAAERVLPLASMTTQHPVKDVEKVLDLRFSARLPFVRELGQLRDTGAFPQDGSTPAARRYVEEVRKLHGMLGAKKT